MLLDAKLAVEMGDAGSPVGAPNRAVDEVAHARPLGGIDQINALAGLALSSFLHRCLDAKDTVSAFHRAHQNDRILKIAAHHFGSLPDQGTRCWPVGMAG